MTKLRLIILLLIVGWQNASAGPVINVGALHEYIQAEKTTLAKRVYNTGDTTAFIRITIDEIIYDSNSNAIEVPLNADALIKGQGHGLISTPPRMIIPAGGMQTNRLIFTGSRDKERYYRVRYIPVVPESNNEFDLSDDDVKKYERKINAGVRMLTGFGTIFTVLPEKPVFNTTIVANKNHLQITNNGNSSIIINELKSCDIKNKKCDDPASVQLRPGRQLVRQAPPTQFWQFVLTEGSIKKRLNTQNPS